MLIPLVLRITLLSSTVTFFSAHVAEELDKSVQALGKYWATLLVHTDAELGIDSEFTRPGILALLGKFKEEVESTRAFEDCKPFKWTK